MFCRKQLGELQGEMDRIRMRGGSVIAISADDPKDGASFASEYQLEFPLLSDPLLDTIRAYGVEDVGNDIALPAVFVIGRDGQIQWRHVGTAKHDRPDASAIVGVLDELNGESP